MSFNQNDLVCAVARDLGVEDETERQLRGAESARGLSISDVEGIVNLIINAWKLA